MTQVPIPRTLGGTLIINVTIVLPSTVPNITMLVRKGDAVMNVRKGDIVMKVRQE